MSVSIVDQTTGNVTSVAGNINDKIGNLSSLITTDKSSVVAAINELGGGVNEIRSDLTNKAETLPFIEISALDINSFAVALHNYILNNCETGKNYNIYGAWAGHTYFNGFAYRVTNSFITILVNIAPDILEIYTNGNSIAVNILTKQNLTFTPSENVTVTYGYVKKQLDVVNLHLQCQKVLTLDGWDQIGRLPEGARPQYNMYIGAVTMKEEGIEAYIECQIASNGYVWIYPKTGHESTVATNILINSTFIV